MEAQKTDLRIERIKYIAAVIMYGTIGMFLRHVSLPSELVALCRGAIGSVFILLFLKVKGRSPDKEAIRKNLLFLVISGICLGLNWVLLFAAYMKTTVAIASLCNYMAPVLVIVAAPLILREKLDKRKLPCIAVAFLGIVLVSGIFGGERGNLPGVIMGLSAAVCFAIIVICNRKLRGISSFDRAVVQLALSSVTLLPYVVIHNRGKMLHADLRSILIILMLGLLHTGVAYIMYFSGMGSLPVQTVAILGYLEPVVSVLCSAFFLHEAMGIAGWIGAVLVLTAAAVSEMMPAPGK